MGLFWSKKLDVKFSRVFIRYKDTHSTSRWPDTIYLHMGRLFSIQIFDPSAAFDCRDILDDEKGMLEVYQKRTFIEIDTNLRKFPAILSNVVFKENAYYWENDSTPCR